MLRVTGFVTQSKTQLIKTPHKLLRVFVLPGLRRGPALAFGRRSGPLCRTHKEQKDILQEPKQWAYEARGVTEQARPELAAHLRHLFLGEQGAGAFNKNVGFPQRQPQLSANTNCITT